MQEVKNAKFEVPHGVQYLDDRHDQLKSEEIYEWVVAALEVDDDERIIDSQYVDEKDRQPLCDTMKEHGRDRSNGRGE